MNPAFIRALVTAVTESSIEGKVCRNFSIRIPFLTVKLFDVQDVVQTVN